VPTAVFRIVKPVSEIDALPGDYLIVHPGRRRPFLLQRTLNPAKLTVLALSDAIEPIPLIRQPDHRHHCLECQVQNPRRSLRLEG